MTAPAIIQDLVNRFRDSRELYRSGRYNEAQLRQEFLNPLFEALGWDMYNRSNFAPQYREVIHEDSLEDQGSVKAPDYAFRIGTTRKFFVEAKKPAVDIRYDIHPAYQLRRYAWNAHLPLSILSDFEELAVYDCRTRPDPGDSAATGRVMLFSFEEYLTRWDELAQTFSKDAVWNGSFDRYAEGSKGKRGTTEVDAEFLKEIEQWRLLLARNIALRTFRPSSNPVIASEAKQSQPASEAKQSPNLHRAERQLNYAVQTTIDRILFLRICEDRKIEPTDQLLQIAEGSDIYAQLLLLFQKADQKYNSGLFHFNKEKGQTSDPDTFTPTLQIDDKVLRQIIKSTYYPCPYMFNEIPVEILGQVYEQFLGSVIRLTPGGQAKVEEKPEVRKAGGVYYTPSYIVDYIVQNTLGRLLGDFAPVPEIVPVSSRSTPPPKAGVGVPSTESDRQVSTSPIVPASAPSTGTDRQVSNPETPPLVPVSLRSTPPPKAGVGVPSTVTDHQVSNPETPPLVPVSRPSTGTDRQVSTSPTSKEQLTPAQALNLRVVDPACGSGSFLLGAFQYLLDWHLNYYLSHDPQSHTRGKNPPLVATEGGEYRLTTETKKRILTSSIYGVDIDAQAVEVTKLSLLLKLLEGEAGQLSLGFERVLPNLDQNIRCGNSLIGWDYFQGQMFPDEEELQRVNPFDWQRAFPHVFAAGGFDAVIGNPPYIQSRSNQFSSIEKKYYDTRYRVSGVQVNTYTIFVEKAISIVRNEGLLGFIIPNYWLSTNSEATFRQFILVSNSTREITNVYNVFANAVVDTVILIAEKSDIPIFPKIYKVQSIDRNLRNIEERLIAVRNRQWYYSVDTILHEGDAIPTISFAKTISLPDTGLKLGDVVNLRFGMKPYQVGKGNPPQKKKVVQSKPFDSTEKLSTEHLPLLRARNVKRYQIIWEERWIRYGEHLAEPRSLDLFTGPRILLQRIVSGRTLDATLANDQMVCNTDVITLKLTSTEDFDHLYFLLGILNSKLIGKYIKSINVNLDRKVFPKINTKTLESLPIPKKTIETKESYLTLVSLVKQMLSLTSTVVKIPSEKELLLRSTNAIDYEIDRQVYELYNLTDEEIKIVESNS